jgi:formiminotetrahydrofolate cyclodeaminase
MLVDRTVRELLDAFGSPAPTPGGGSAAALASAVGASLLLMVASLPKTRTNSEEDRAALASAAAGLHGMREHLAAAVDADAAAYDHVVTAYKLPKGSAEEHVARTAAIQYALHAATDVPLGVMRESERALQAATIVAAHGNRSAASDVGVAIALLRTGAAGAKLNVEINLDAITDEAYREDARAEAGELMQSVGETAARAEAGLRTGL